MLLSEIGHLDAGADELDDLQERLFAQSRLQEDTPSVLLVLQAMDTGHEGSLTTAHANNPREALSRLEVMVMMSGMELPMTVVREQISSAVDLIVHQKRFPCGSRKVSHITELTGMESGTIQLQDVFLFKARSTAGRDGKVVGEFVATGAVPEFYEELAERGVAVDLDIFRTGGRRNE